MVSSKSFVNILKWTVGISIMLALFFSYQLPEGFYQQIVKKIFIGVALICMVVVLNQKSETSKKWLNLTLTIILGITLVLYFMEAV